ncbi:MAG: DUF2142 domain-containing protein [Anaerolineaceae bacterium]|nr:DUF2142 domain-containing protein [Anaerolineaceae bacterium]
MIIGLLAGTLLAVFVPYGAGYDEDSHIIRIFDIASGNLIPSMRNKEDVTFTEFYTMSYKRSYLQVPANDFFSREKFFLRADRYNASGVTTHSTYSPFVFLLDAVIARIAWIYLDLPLLPVILFMRFAGLCLFLLVGMITIKILPTGKWIMAILLLAPMSLYQASTLNGDRFTIGVSVFFIAVVLKTFTKKEEPLNLKDTLLVALATVLVGVSKPGTIIILPMLLILLRHQFATKKLKWLFLFSIAFSVTYSIGWSFLAVLGTTVASTGTTRAYQIQLILKNFLDFLKVYFVGIYNLIPRYYTDWVAEYGYWMGKVPWPVYLFFPIALVLAFLTESRKAVYPRRMRLFIGLLAIFCLAVIASVKFIWAYVPGNYYFGSQGRYFLSFAPLLFMAFSGLVEVRPNWRKLAKIGSILFIFAALVFYGVGVYRTYYTTCIFAVDANHPCTLPVYRNLDIQNPVNLPLTAGSSFEQTFVPKCDPINAIDLRVLTLDGATTGTVQVSLFNSADELLQQSQVPLSEIRVGEQNQFSFPTAATKMDETYSFQVSLSEDASATLGLWGTPDDGYTAGQLLINGSPSESAFDLYLQYECPR